MPTIKDLEISYYKDSAWTDITELCKHVTIDDYGIQKANTAQIKLHSNYANLVALLASHHYPLRILYLGNAWHRIFYGSIWGKQSAPEPAASLKMSIDVDTRGIAQRLADDHVTVDYWALQSARYPDAMWTYASMLADMLFRPDSGYDTGFQVVVTNPTNLNAVIDRAATFSKQSLMEACRTIYDKTGYDGYYDVNDATGLPSCFIKPIGSGVSVATLTQPFLDIKIDDGSLDDIVNLILVTGGVDSSVPPDDRFTEKSVTKYSPAIWSAHVNTGTATVADAPNSSFVKNSINYGVNDYCIEASVTTTDFDFYVELNPSAALASGVDLIDCLNRCRTLQFYIVAFTINPNLIPMHHLQISLIDDSGNAIRYYWGPPETPTLVDQTVYKVEIKLGTKIFPAGTTNYLTWMWDTPTTTTFNWARVQKLRIQTGPVTGSYAMKQWKIQIDGLKFIGGIAIDPFEKYADTLSGIAQCLGHNEATGGTNNEAIDINNSTPNDVALPPFQTTVVGDYMVFCYTTPFRSLKLKINTAAVYSGITFAWQYWNGTAWTALNCIDGSVSFTKAGTHWLVFDMPNDWAKLDIGFGYPYYIVRCIVTALNAPSITTFGLAEQGWFQIGNNPPILDSNSIDLYGVHALHLQDTLIDNFDYAGREAWRVLNNLHLPIPTMDIKIPALLNLVHPSDLVTVTVPQINVTSELWRIFKIHYEWDSSNKRLYQTLGITQQTKPIPPIWAQIPEMRSRVR